MPRTKPQVSAADDPLGAALVDFLFESVSAGSSKRADDIVIWSKTLNPADAASLVPRIALATNGASAGDLQPTLDDQLSPGGAKRVREAFASRARAAASGTADPATSNRMTSGKHRGVEADPELVSRCREHKVKKVPDKYETFEKEIMKWISTCVQSRTHDVKREVALVKGNKSLAALYKLLIPGKAAKIVPKYNWGESRVESIEFSSPDAKGPISTRITWPPPSVTSSKQLPSDTPATDDEPDADVEVEPKKIQTKKPDKDTPEPIDPPPPEFPDAHDLILDGQQLEQLLRDQGDDTDADSLKKLLEQGAQLLVEVASLVGGYYLGTRFVAGELAFLWSWDLMDPADDYAVSRQFGRLDRLLPDVNDALGRIVTIATQQADTIGGSGLTWKVLDEILDPSVPGQIDRYACGPACAEIVLGDRGITISQADAARLARSVGVVKNGSVKTSTLLEVIQSFDSKGTWHGGAQLEIPGATKKQLVQALNKTGSWIALVDKHFVVVDGMTDAGDVLIRDPWTDPPGSGTRYRVTWRSFVRRWSEVGIYRL